MAIRTRGKYVYQSDDGAAYAVTLADDIAAEPNFGWVAAGAEPELPKGHQMRYALLQDPATGQSFQRPIATVGAIAYSDPKANSYAIDQWNDAADVTCIITSVHGEKRLLGTYAAGPVAVVI